MAIDPTQEFDSDNDPAVEVDEPVTSIQKIFGFPVPEGTLRVQVVDEKGSTKWRKLDDVKISDVPSLTGSGQPIFMSRPVGRPAKIDPQTLAPPSTKLVGDLIKIKAAQMRNDPISQVAEVNPESPDVLNMVIQGIAEEAASLRFERMEAERNGEDTSPFSVRRVQALKAVGDTWIKRKEQIQNREIDLDGKPFEALIKFVVETFSTSMQNAGVRTELQDSVFASFEKLIGDDTWKNEARSRMKD